MANSKIKRIAINRHIRTYAAQRGFHIKPYKPEIHDITKYLTDELTDEVKNYIKYYDYERSCQKRL